MKQTKPINFELLRDPVLDHGIISDSNTPQNIMVEQCSVVRYKKCVIEKKAPSEDAEMLYDRRVLNKNFNGLSYSFQSLVIWSLSGTSFFCYSDKAQPFWKK